MRNPLTTEPDANPHLTLNAAVYDNQQTVNDICRQLHRLGSASHMLGMAALDEQLSEIAEVITASAQRICDAHGDALGARVRESEQATANMMKAAMAGLGVLRS